ncbi:hypothetical protein G5B37_10230 [Rasiella rasia]|uniref:Uncharacterized protein n=1 Tax=Rasiella rasia TaxID=2744027 RepID=A0A6G6GN10_9FLAO|nr:hypothetical protein [Rasiella rasia]QIE59928.1 hypothetical protein G5B37_10230 [Rasiella rasia]
MIVRITNKVRQLVANPLALIFVLLVLSEFAYKICLKEYWHFFKISAALKLLLQVFFIVQIARDNIKKLWPVFVLVLFFMLGQLGWVPFDLLKKNILFLDRYLYVILALIYVTTITDVKKYYPLFFKVFEVFIIVNSILIFVGFLFELNLFNTYYGFGKRFGVNGLILRSGAGTYIYWIALFYYATECFVLNKKKIIPLVIVFLASLLLGTKAIFLAIMFIAIFIWTTYNGHKNKLHWVGITVATVVAIVYFKDGLVWVLSKSDSLNVVYQERGWFSAMVSLRDQHLLEELLPLVQEKWTWRNYLFGGGYDMHFRSQFGVLDLLYFFGIIGSVVYLMIFSKLFVTFRLNKITAIFLVGTFILMAFSANFFYETIMAFYLVLIKGYFESNFKKEKVT